MYQWDLQTLIVLAHEFIFSNGTVEALDMGIEPFYNVFFYLSTNALDGPSSSCSISSKSLMVFLNISCCAICFS